MEIPGEKLVIKLWETLADKGIGTLLKPWQIRREGRATLEVRRDELLALAQAESDAAAIRDGQKQLLPTGELVAIPALLPPTEVLQQVEALPLSLPHVVQIAEQNSKAEAVRQEVAIAKAILFAERELHTDPAEPSPETLQEDWLLRWRDSAAGVSSEELQQLWGKVLAGEVKSPGRFSLRALEFLRNLSQAEALAIERISPFVIAGIIYRGDDAMLEGEGVKFSDLLAMQELGVLAGVDGLGLQISWISDKPDSFQKVLVSHDAVLWVTATESTKAISLKVCTVTAIGKQLLGLGIYSPNSRMLESVASTIKAQGFEVQLGSCIQISDNQIQAFNLRPL